jgi:hypothetical protein
MKAGALVGAAVFALMRCIKPPVPEAVSSG